MSSFSAAPGSAIGSKAPASRLAPRRRANRVGNPRRRVAAPPAPLPAQAAQAAPKPKVPVAPARAAVALAPAGVGNPAVPAVHPGVDNSVMDVLEMFANPIHDRTQRGSQVRGAHDGLYWESHRVWREWLENHIKKKKTKNLKLPKLKGGYYYEDEDEWNKWKNDKDIDAHYKARLLPHHQHISHDRIHDNIDIHTGHHMLEAYVHKRATRKNVLYLAHVLREQGGRVYLITDDHKPKFLMDIAHLSEAEIVTRFPKRKPFAILLRYHHHHDHGFTGGSVWNSPEYQEGMMNSEHFK